MPEIGRQYARTAIGAAGLMIGKLSRGDGGIIGWAGPTAKCARFGRQFFHGLFVELSPKDGRGELAADERG
jgi:hypothetical protein